MPIQPPRLDDRSYEDIRGELLRRIPLHSAEWTDHNPSDPGVALLELFAWLTENTLARLNRVPENARLEFLKLLEIPLRSASPAHTLLRAALRTGADQPVVLPLAPGQPRAVVAAGKIEFQVTDEVDVLPIEAVAAIKLEGPLASEAADGAPLDGAEDLGTALRFHLGRNEAIPASQLRTYQTTVITVPKGAAGESPADLAAAVDRALWIALLVPERLKGIKDDLRRRLAGRVLSIGVWTDDTLCGPTDHRRCPDAGSPPAPTPITWQIASGGFTKPRRSDGRNLVTDARYERLAVESDGTEGLLRTGVVRVRLPQSEADIGAWTAADFGNDPDLLGAMDLPPPLQDEKLEARVIAWVRCVRGDEQHPRLRYVDINAVPAMQAVTAEPEMLGRGTGLSGQALTLSKTPVIPESLSLEVYERAQGWVAWFRVDSLAASGRADPHYTIDALTGTVGFGDGVHGRLLRRGELVRARSYRYGGGVRGNAAPDTITRVVRLPPSVQVEFTNPLGATGGVDAETLEEARTRIPLVLRHNDRAVARDDFADLAMGTPGVCVGRVHVLPRHKPHERLDGVPGVVTLVVVPAYDPAHPDEPTPDKEMLRRVCEHMEPRRLVTTELYVTPPEYVPVWISIAIEAAEGFGVSTVRRWVELAVRQYLAPLPPYGPAGAGWAFGRAVRSQDVEAAALRVQGVRLVNAVLLEGDQIDRRGARSRKKATGQCENVKVALESWQLPVVRNVQVTAGATAEAITFIGDAPIVRDDLIPVPLEKEVC